jgi:hypothetical protein
VAWANEFLGVLCADAVDAVAGAAADAGPPGHARLPPHRQIHGQSVSPLVRLITVQRATLRKVVTLALLGFWLWFWLWLWVRVWLRANT